MHNFLAYFILPMNDVENRLNLRYQIFLKQSSYSIPMEQLAMISVER